MRSFAVVQGLVNLAEHKGSHSYYVLELRPPPASSPCRGIADIVVGDRFAKHSFATGIRARVFRIDSDAFFAPSLIRDAIVVCHILCGAECNRTRIVAKKRCVKSDTSKNGGKDYDI